jgi:hypothetical protein
VVLEEWGGKEERGKERGEGPRTFVGGFWETAEPWNNGEEVSLR